MRNSTKKSKSKNPIVKGNPNQMGNTHGKVSGKSQDVPVGDDYNCQRSKPNDWRWYAQNEQLLRDAASFPYGWPLGNRLNLGQYGENANKGSIPGIMGIHVSPSFGWSDNANSPINVAARNIYSYVRHANSGHANYDAPDLMLYLCAMDSLYSYLSFLKRIYGVAMTYSYTNRYFPKAVIQAMGVDFDDIHANLSDFRSMINSYAVRIGSMCVPASMSFMAKHMWMFDGYYADSNQQKAQTYMFVPDGFYRYSLDSDGAGCLEYEPLIAFEANASMYPPFHWERVYTPINLTYMRNYMDKLLDPVLQSEDMNIMSGDILKAFGSGNIYTVSMINEQYVVLPSYSEEVLDQIQNLTLIGEFQSGSAILKQDSSKGYLEFMPFFLHEYNFELADEEDPGQNAFFMDRIITFERDSIEPKDTMEATRMTNIVSEYNPTKRVFTCHTFGSEVAHYAIIYAFMDHAGEWVLTESPRIKVGLTNMLDINSTAMDVDVVIRMGRILEANALLIEQLSQFNRHPVVVITTGIQDLNSDTATHIKPYYGTVNGMQLDVNNYAILGVDDLTEMSLTALLSEFNITQYGRAAQ